MGVFKVLMWKHYTVRKRRFIQTLVEFLTPISLILGLFILRDDMRSVSADMPVHDLDSMSDMVRTVQPIRILYTPETEFTNTLMTEVGNVLKLPRVDISEDSNTRGYFAYQNNSDAKSFYKSMKPDDAIIEFQIPQAAERDPNLLPHRLRYTIRVKRPVAAASERAQFKSNEFGPTRDSLMKLQWAIDSSYIKLTAKKNVQNITIKEIPRRRAVARAVNKLYVNTLFYLLAYSSFLSPVLPFIFLMSRLLEERSSGIQELVKMVGVTPTLLGITQYINALPPCLIYSVGGALLLKCTSDPMVPDTDPVIMFLGLFLHYNTVIAMCFTCSYMAKNAQYTVSLALFVYIGMWIPIRLFEHDGHSNAELFFLGLLPHCPAYWFVNEVNVAEVWYEHGVHFNNWHIQYALHPSGGRNGSVVVSFIMQMTQIIYFFMFAWYLEKVFPGRYGIARPWNFLFQKEYWIKPKANPAVAGPEQSFDPAYQKYFEDPPKNMEVGIEILHVSKIFGRGKKRFQALNDLSLNVYKGEITVLLGHNGAGKTTIFSIITGMINPTSGSIKVNGLNTVTQQSEVRKHLGFCPQHNLVFPDLTVFEHFLFFSLIKGGTIKGAKASSKALLNQLNLTEKASRKPAELSGGMLRRLQLGCALCGNANVLILDEPTSGLDVESRRELWDMLLALRGDRTLILTTHFMEEADVLGDRLAALHAGRLRSHATPMFLKRAVGSDFRLTVRTLNSNNEQYITKLVQDVVSGAKLKEQSGGTLIYELPSGTNMPLLFNTIEKRKEELNIESVGVGITSLEEVFLELCCDIDAASVTQEEARTTAVTYVTGCRLKLRQMFELWRRQWNYTRSRLLAYIILQILIPLVMCTMLTQIFNNGKANLDVELSSSTYSSLNAPVSSTFDFVNNDENATRRINTSSNLEIIYPKYMVKKSVSELRDYNVLETKDQIKSLGHIFYIKTNSTNALVQYDPTIMFSANLALNTLSNVLAADLTKAEDKTISTNISRDLPYAVKIHIPKDKINCALFAIFNIFMILGTAINDVTLPCKERLSVARHTHLMTGCPPYLYWLTTFLYHMTGYLLFCCSATMIAAAFFDLDKTINDNATLRSYFVALILCGINLYAFSYFISFYLNERGASMLLIGFTIIFGFLSPILMMALDEVKKDDGKPTFSKVMDALGVLIPAHVFTQAVTKMTHASRFNSFCRHNFDLCPKLPYYSDGFDAELCCAKGSKDYGPFNHFAFSKYAMGYYLVIVTFQFIIYSTLVLLLQYGVINRWWNTLGKLRRMEKPEKKYNAPQVSAEKTYVNDTIKSDRKQIPDNMLVCNVWKMYFKLFSKPTFALRDVNFSVKKGECFGLIGVNGAGKTTTFKVAACEETATEGTVFVNGHFLGTEQYIRSLGYCPQFFGLDEFRSGTDNIRMLLVLRGFSTEDVQKEMASWLNVVGMTRHAHRTVAGYSGGMVRRLATAAALCGGAPATMLDEPTTGVDTAARRLLWAAMRRGQQDGRSVVLASNSMDEMETLCDRVTILKQGEMCVLGTPHGLRDQYAAGHAIILKLRVKAVQSPTGSEQVQKLKAAMQENFNCNLKDQHLTSLHYQVIEKLPYSVMFEKMDKLAREHRDVIEDFSVTDTTLEDVFLYVNNEA